MRYFPEGVEAQGGEGHEIRNIIADRVCDDAISVDRNVLRTGDPIIIDGNIINGTQSPDSGYVCFDTNTISMAPCGVDKAIQINGGTTELGESPFPSNTVGYFPFPVRICSAGGAGCPTLPVHGPHYIAYNRFLGRLPGLGAPFNCHNAYTGAYPYCPAFPCSCDLHLPEPPIDDFSDACEDVSQAIVLGNTGLDAQVQVFNNEFQYLKNGIEVEGGARALISNNTIKANYRRGIWVQGPNSHVAGWANIFANVGCDPGTVGSPNGPIVATGSGSVLDFGLGGFYNEVSGGWLAFMSPGANRICTDPVAVTSLPRDIVNNTASIGYRSSCFGTVGWTVGRVGKVFDGLPVETVCAIPASPAGPNADCPGPSSCTCTGVFP